MLISQSPTHIPPLLCLHYYYFRVRCYVLNSYHATGFPWKSSRMLVASLTSRSHGKCLPSTADATGSSSLRCPVRISSSSSSRPSKATFFLCPISTSHQLRHLDHYPWKSSHTSREWDAVPLSTFPSLQIKDTPKLESLSAAHVTSGKQSLLAFLFFFFPFLFWQEILPLSPKV